MSVCFLLTVLSLCMACWVPLRRIAELTTETAQPMEGKFAFATSTQFSYDRQGRLTYRIISVTFRETPGLDQELSAERKSAMASLRYSEYSESPAGARTTIGYCEGEGHLTADAADATLHLDLFERVPIGDEEAVRDHYLRSVDVLVQAIAANERVFGVCDRTWQLPDGDFRLRSTGWMRSVGELRVAFDGHPLGPLEEGTTDGIFLDANPPGSRLI